MKMPEFNELVDAALNVDHSEQATPRSAGMLESSADLEFLDSALGPASVSSEIAWEDYLAAVERDLAEAKKDSSTNLLKTYIAYANHKSRLDAAVKRVTKYMADIQEAVLDVFSEQEIEKFTASGRTISPRREVWAGHQEDQKEELMSALKSAGLGDYVAETYNTMSLSAYVREFDPEKSLSAQEIVEKLPEELRPFIKVSEVTKINNRKA